MGTLATDTVLGDRYRLAGRIAIGGMGEVWRADDTLLHRPVAVKVLKTELSTDAVFLDRFRNEARSAAAFSHAGIANVYDYGEAGDTAYLVMELVEGEPLAAILARYRRLPVETTLDYVGQAATALHVAHRTGMVHRDIKPGNLLITPDGTVKITDFGIARAASTLRLTQAGMVMGTAQYFSPEQAEGRPVGPTSDVYSLGVVAFECLTGWLPFTADSPVTVALMQIRNVPPPLPPDVPPLVRAVVERAMAKDARLRYANGGELAAAVTAAREGRFDPVPLPAPVMVTVPPPPVTGPIPVPPRRRAFGLWALLGVLLLLVAAGVVIWLVMNRDDTGAGTGTRSGAGPTAPTATLPSAQRTLGGAIPIDPAAYLGERPDDVVAQLRGLGLVPMVAGSGDVTTPRDTVTGLMYPAEHPIHASTSIPRGSTVLVVIGSVGTQPTKGDR